MNMSKWSIGATVAGTAIVAVIATGAGTGQIHFGNSADITPTATATHTTAPKSAPKPKAKAHHHKAGHRDGTKITINNNLAPSNPAPAANPPQAPIQTGAYGPYLNALAAAGIVAPNNWAVQAANNLEAAWAAGETEAQTDQQYLIPGGIYPWHCALFDSIVHEYFG